MRALPLKDFVEGKIMIRSAIVVAAIAAALPAYAQNLPSNPGVVGVITGMVTGTYAATGADLTILDDPKIPLRVLPILGKGSLQNLDDILHTRGVDVAFLQADAKPYAIAHHLFPASELARVQYIAKLYDEQVHVIARSEIKTFSDLAGKKVNTDVVGSGSAMTADVLLQGTGISAQVSHMKQADAVRALENGEIDAIIHVGGAPIPLFATLPEGDLHFLDVPLRGDLAETYLPDDITHTEYPNLIKAGDPPVKTLAIGDVMAVFGWDPNNPRYHSVAKFVDALFDRFGELQQPPRHPKWREVNLGASAPGWTRFPEAQVRLDQIANPGLAGFMIMKELAGLSDHQKRALYDAVEKIRQGAQK